MDLKEKIKQMCRGEVVFDASLADYSTLRAGGKAEILVRPAGIDDLSLLLAELAGEGIGWQVIGNGSNILALDQGVSGVVIVIGREISSVRLLETNPTVRKGEEGRQVAIRVEAGCSLSGLLNWCMKESLSGVEFLAGIPGSVGGAVVMNAGAMGAEIGSLISEVGLLSEHGEFRCVKVCPKDFQYRRWSGSGEGIIVYADFRLKRGDAETIKNLCRQNVLKRKQIQPQGASAGSFFKNPPGDYAGRLIEQAHLKGTRIGGAEISPVHGNFIVNTGGATATDILALMKLAQSKVQENTGIWLEPEVKIIGG